MIAVIRGSVDLKRSLNYNENKIIDGSAALLDAGYYLEDLPDLNYEKKLSRLANRNALNDRARGKTLHISLNFAPGEKLSPRQLKQIAALYLDKMGLVKHPYLLYEHYDSGHQHVHVLTTAIREDGSNVNAERFVIQRSKKAVAEIERIFGLLSVNALKKRPDNKEPLPALKPAVYGSYPTKQMISQILRHVLYQYKYSSLTELNAALRLYNVQVDRGKKSSDLYKSGGLLYRVIDERGKTKGVPIKASDIDFKPTLKFLLGRFSIDQAGKSENRTRVKNVIDFAFLNRSHSLESLKESLKKEGVQMDIRTEKPGGVYNITFVDLRTKSAFDSLVLGAAYSAESIMQRCRQADQKPLPGISLQKTELYDRGAQSHSRAVDIDADAGKLLGDLLLPVNGYDPVPWELRKTKKKKRKGIGQ